MDATVLVQIGDEFARKNFNIANEEVWILTSYNLGRNKLVLEYTNMDLIAIKVEIQRTTIEGMAEGY
mgnify:CR=1 FL=1